MKAFRSDLSVTAQAPWLFNSPRAPFHLIEVAVGQPVLVQESAILLLDGQVEPPEIAVILIGRVALDRLVDDPEMDELGLGAWTPARLNSRNPTDSNSPCSPRWR